MVSRVLLVDDDTELSSMLAAYLQGEGFETETAADGEQGAARALAGGIDLVVLDVMMPGVDGIETLRRIRAASRLPVLMLTARGDDIDRIVGLELGADDYVPKPCTPRELVARIRAILRRGQPLDADGAGVGEVIRNGPIELWPTRRRAYRDGATLELTGTEFGLLEVLVRHAGQVVDRQTLSSQALGRPLARFDRSIDVHVSSIRTKLGPRQDGDPWIQTVRGKGYQLVTP
ncbi:MAG: response regulator [Burkholderiaceae bacterium]|nr:response regulator [Burkholderiaceae bacterium]